MAPDYKNFWEHLKAYTETVRDETEREDLRQQLDSLADRKTFSLADWELLTSIESKLMMERSSAASKVRQLLTAGLQQFRR